MICEHCESQLPENNDPPTCCARQMSEFAREWWRETGDCPYCVSGTCVACRESSERPLPATTRYQTEDD